MIRLLLTLNVMLAIAGITYVLIVNNTLGIVLRSPIENHYQRLGQGTLALLNESVRGLDVQQRQQKLAELKQQFVYPFDIKPIAELNFNAHETQRLQQGLVVRRELKNIDYLYGTVAGTTHSIWSVAVDQPRIMDEANSSQGTYYLLQQSLAGKTPAEWQTIIAERSKQFGFPVILLEPGALTLSAAEQEQLTTGQTLVILHDEHSETHYQPVGGNGHLLQFGPFETPSVARYLNPVVLTLLFLFMSLISYFWFWPIWRNLLQIKTAAEAFGRGHYATRVPHQKRSRLAGLTYAFNAMAERTQNSIRSQKELTSAVSHELRTPVARMRFSLDMLATTDNTADRQRYIENMNVDIDELNGLLEEVLTYSRLDQSSDAIKLQSVPLASWFNGVMQNSERLSHEKTLHWHTEHINESTTTLMCPLMMGRVVNNLVQNALRFANQQIDVLLIREGNHFLLRVDDDGPGIPSAERERLFEAFAIQDDSRNKELSGFGLGLAIVKRIVDGHQGSVSIETAELGGARFLVRWPAP